MPAYEFHYTPDEGALAGLTFEQQTEDAINDLGNNAYNAGTNAAAALEQATAAAKAATEAKNLANSAQTTAANAQTTATNAGTAAKAAQNTADEAKANAATNAANIATNTAAISSNAANIAKNTAILEALQASSGTAATDLTDLKTAVQTNTNNISTLFDGYKDLITFDNASDVTDANLAEDYGVYEVSGATVANLPNSSDAFVFEVRQNTTETDPRIFQTAIDEADGALYVRVGEMADSGTTWGAWTSSRVDVSKYAPIDSPALTGTPTAPTATAGTSTTQIASTAFVANALADIDLDIISPSQVNQQYNAITASTAGTKDSVVWTVTNSSGITVDPVTLFGTIPDGTMRTCVLMVNCKVTTPPTVTYNNCTLLTDAPALSGGSVSAITFVGIAGVYYLVSAV